MALRKDPLIQVQNVTKVFPRPDTGGSFTVLEDLSLDIMPGEVVALLGRSGSGKSTLLRAIAGLLKPTKGQVISTGKLVRAPNPDVAMVFQSFALLPWKTVQENVELGLESKKLDRKEARRKANEALKLVGLDGFEKAYPKELSGGMQQRVGFARAFVVRPVLMLLDEPFSALDVLTAENLRGEIGDLWQAGTFPAESIIIVTHNIEEAIIMADRLVIMSSNPGTIRGELRVTLPRPRERNAAFRAMADHVYTIMTNPESKITQVKTARQVQGVRIEDQEFAPLPHARAGAISGLLELVEEYGGPEDVAVLSERLRMEVDDLLPILDAAVLLGFARVNQGDVTVTDIGKEFINAVEIEGSKEVFGRQALENAPLVAAMYEAVQSRGDKVEADEFLDVLDNTYSEEEARRQFGTAIDWGRYAGLFEYDSDEEQIKRPTDEASGVVLSD